MKRWLWIGGWALRPEWQARQFKAQWPDYIHDVLAPDKLCLAEYSRRIDSGTYERLGGYSLGTLLLLRSFEREPVTPTLLLAPVLDFKTEAARGGRMRRAHLDALERKLKQEPLAAVNDFYARAGLTIEPTDTLPYQVEDLLWGIEQLRTTAATHWRWDQVKAIIGERDPLLDAVMLQQLWPGLVILPRAGHDLAELIVEAAA